MECVYSTNIRNTCWRGYNFCKHLKMSDRVPKLATCMLETQKLTKIPDNKPCGYFTKSKVTAIRRTKKFREQQEK